jgi:cyanobactin maturation PatA/PatG family protease
MTATIQNPDNDGWVALQTLQELGNHGAGIRIAVIDGGIDHHHPLLANVDVSHYSGSGSPTGHGTAVCSVIAGNATGLARQATILAYPVFHEDLNGQIRGCSERNLARAINQAAVGGCEIINISGASLSSTGRPGTELDRAINLCRQKNILVVAATGNDGQKSESLPASIDGVLAVGACDQQGTPLSFNNHGRKLRHKMLLASGMNMPVAMPDAGLALVSGSSFATPVVSSVCALLWNIFKRGNISGAEIPARILESLYITASTIRSDIYGGNRSPYFRLNITDLLNMVKGKNDSPEICKSKRNTDMSINENAEIVQPSEAYESTAATVSADMSHNTVAAAMDARETLTPAALSLPEIADSAPRQNVHAGSQTVRPQTIGTDARSMQGEDKVYVIGTVGYDFGTEARLDYFTQVMGGAGLPFDPVEMAKHLEEGDNAEQSSGLIWTLKIDGIPVYAIEPENQFAVLQYARLVRFLVEQETAGVERVSIAGYITGEVKLFNGQIVPRISPVLRGMFNWKTKVLTDAVVQISGNSGNALQQEAISNFLNRVYYELRNLGQESHERAINYSASNAYQMKEIFEDAIKNNLFLNKISAEKSPVSRPQSDCWDVVLEFFNPKERLTSARKLYRYTIDVSDIIPVTVGTLRSWFAY